MKVVLLNLLKNIGGSKKTPPIVVPNPQTIPAKKILVVEDEEALRQLYIEVLSQEGFEVKGAENGQVALSLIPQFQPNLILLDLMMPVMDGKQLDRKSTRLNSSH